MVYVLNDRKGYSVLIWKMKKKVSSADWAAFAGSAALLAGCASAAPVEQKSETVSAIIPFEITCSAETKADFTDLVALLHSFEYLETHKRSDSIIAREPGCAMGYWSKAMSIWHPLWEPPSKTDLEQGIHVLAQTDALEKSPKEQALIDALKAFYASTDLATNKKRAGDFANAMMKISIDYPNDYEVEIFYALGLLSAADPRDKTYINQYKAGEILKRQKIDHPLHPGVLHYIIHSYDFPGLAQDALEEAKAYAGSAKNSTHAQHMPSHIFTRLGMWERSLSSNHDSAKSAANYTEHAQLPGHDDQGLHSIDYLMYAMLQTGRDAEAQQLLTRLENIKKTNTESLTVAHTYAASPARYVLERRAWHEAADLPLLRPDFRWKNFSWARAINVFARGIGAARSGNIEQAKTELAKIKKIQDGLSPTLMVYFSTEVQVQRDLINAWIMFAEGNFDVALSLAKATAELEDSLDKHPVTPGEVLPARELYGDMLSETGDYSAALAQYEIVLKGSPNRLNALLGAQRSATKIKNIKSANSYAEIIHDQIKFGDRVVALGTPN
jgi:tetratricopeptide (TPR) repeat protein